MPPPPVTGKPGASTLDWPKGKIWEAISAIVPLTRRTLLYGPPGTGKTHAATTGGIVPGEQVFSVTLTPETPATALLGHWVPKPNPSGGTELQWLDGPGCAAWRASHAGPVRLVLNEIDHAGPDSVSALHVLLDDLKTAAITLPTGETIRPAKGFRVVATMNGVPDDLAPAIADRFPVRFNVREVAPGAIAILPESLRAIAEDSALSPDPQRRVSIRAWLAVAELLSKGANEEIAARAVFGERWLDLLTALKVSAASPRGGK